MRVRLRDTIEVFEASSGEIFITHGAATATLVIRDPKPRDRAVFAALRREALCADELASEVSALGYALSTADARATLRQLIELNVAEEPSAALGSGLGSEDLDRFDRQLAYFADIVGQRAAYAAQRRLRDSHVVVLGCGGLGSWTAVGLACSGIRKLTLVDPDTVALSNLNRQLLFAREDVGSKKVHAAARALGRFDPALIVQATDDRIEAAADVARLAADADLVVATADEPPGRIARWINDGCEHTGTPWISAGQFPPHVRIGPLNVPGATACHECMEAGARRTHPLYAELAEHRALHPVLAATTGPASGLIGSLLANEIVAHLTAIHTPATLGHTILIDLRTLTTRIEAVAPDPGCAACRGPVAA